MTDLDIRNTTRKRLKQTQGKITCGHVVLGPYFLGKGRPHDFSSETKPNYHNISIYSILPNEIPHGKDKGKMTCGISMRHHVLWNGIRHANLNYKGWACYPNDYEQLTL